MAATWSDILLPGGYDGETFDFVRSSLEGGNDLDQQSRPNTNGQTIKGRGRKGRRFRILAVFIEDDYPEKMNRVIAKLENGGAPKEFTDPVFGSMQASVDSFSVLHDADDASDSAMVDISFIENTGETKGPKAITNTTPARANAVRSAAADALVALSAFQAATEVQNNAYVLQVTAAMNTANSVADTLEETGEQLSVPEVQAQANATLSTIDIAVAAGSDYDSTEAYELGQAMLAMAAAAAALAQDLIEAKPPLEVRTVVADTNLLALAHDFYGDSSRADELLALNAFPDPSLIVAGFKVQAYGF